ncbi:MAG: AraC family transcriptional regulator [Proteobacteria bacterium]|nr:AraC family transcriptional regulator [Pseudomonadota bacterium]
MSETDGILAPLRAQSPLFRSGRAMTIESAYHINDALTQSESSGAGGYARRFEPIDRRGYQADPEDFKISFAACQAGGMRVAANVVKRGLAMVVKVPDESIYTFGFRRQGSLSVRGTGPSNEGDWGPGIGVLYQERQGMRVAISDDHLGLAFDLSRARIAAILSALIERPVVAPLDFDATFSLTSEPGASVARVAEFIEQELSIPDSFLARGEIASKLDDLLIRSLLNAQRHSYSHLLELPSPAASPSNVRRAEAFMRAHAHLPLTIEMIATEAGCSVRALQAAFQKFRDGTPLRTLRKIRLELAHNDIRRQEAGASLLDVAMKYQFSNPGRFAKLYRQTYGLLPSATRRRG